MECHEFGIRCEPMEIKLPFLSMTWLEIIGEEEYVCVDMSNHTADPFQTTPVSLFCSVLFFPAASNSA